MPEKRSEVVFEIFFLFICFGFFVLFCLLFFLEDLEEGGLYLKKYFIIFFCAEFRL